MPVLTADGMGVRSRGGWIVRDIDLQVRRGEIVVITGEPGSGRTTLLLALADRFKVNAGRVRHRGTVALGHVRSVHEPDPVLTVAEHVRERLLLLGRPVQQAAGILTDRAYRLDPTLRGRDLSPYQRHLLGLTLARLSHPDLIAVDDIDTGLHGADRAALWAALSECADAGTAIVATSRELDPGRSATCYPIGGQP